MQEDPVGKSRNITKRQKTNKQKTINRRHVNQAREENNENQWMKNP